MKLFGRLLGNKAAKVDQPHVRFGRYSDSYKETTNYEAWETALEKFEKEEYIDSYIAFLSYLRDETEDNVRWQSEGNGIHFELLQGSKKITGFADWQKLKAEAKIAKSQALNVGFMRRLVEQNYNLKYSRFALDHQNNITIVFDTSSLDGSPYKLYYALKELAVYADKHDDLLIDEFKTLQLVDSSHLEALPDKEREAKYNFIVGQITRVLEEVNSGPLDKHQYPGAIAYLLLNLVYKIDYLTKPEGFAMESLERMHRLYFGKDQKSTEQKNHLLCKELQKLCERPREDYFKEMYRVTSTFGITNPVNHNRVVDFIDGELHHTNWYLDNGHSCVALAIPGYIIGYCMFNYAVPKPDRDFFHLYFTITEPGYFAVLGFQYDYYDPRSGIFNKKSIRKAIQEIVESNKKEYPQLNPQTSSLEYESLAHFARSFLLMVRHLDLSRAD